MRITLIIALLAFSLPVYAQYNGPAVEACRAYARKDLEREGNKPKDVILERDRALVIERYTRKLGSQFVSSILTGNGAIVMDGSPSSELSFICLLADEKRPVFFNWLARMDTSSLMQCARSEELRARSRECLELLQRVADQDLTELYGQRLQEANERGEKVLAAYRKSNEEWLQYRTAECVRQRDYAPKGVSPDDQQLACTVDLTRRRVLDMR